MFKKKTTKIQKKVKFIKKKRFWPSKTDPPEVWQGRVCLLVTKPVAKWTVGRRGKDSG